MEYSGQNAIIGTAGAGIGGLVVGAGLGYIAGKRSNRKKSKSRKKSKGRVSRKRNNSNRKLKFGSKAYRKKYLGKGRRKTPYTARKGKDTSQRRIRYTKKGQPYVIQANGRARFISMKSANQSHKRKGGKY